jgi:hypothetical protein
LRISRGVDGILEILKFVRGPVDHVDFFLSVQARDSSYCDPRRGDLPRITEYSSVEVAFIVEVQTLRGIVFLQPSEVGFFTMNDNHSDEVHGWVRVDDLARHLDAFFAAGGTVVEETKEDS